MRTDNHLLWGTDLSSTQTPVLDFWDIQNSVQYLGHDTQCTVGPCLRVTLDIFAIATGLCVFPCQLLPVLPEASGECRERVEQQTVLQFPSNKPYLPFANVLVNLPINVSDILYE